MIFSLPVIACIYWTRSSRLCPGPERGERCVACLQPLADAESARRRFLDMERVLRAPDMVLTPSVFLAQRMQTFFPFLEGKLRVVPLGVDPIAGEHRQRVPRTPGSPLRVLYVGVLAPHKGAHVLLEALRGLPVEKVTASLYGTEWSQWQTYCDQLHAAASELSVKFCGTYTQTSLARFSSNTMCWLCR